MIAFILSLVLFQGTPASQVGAVTGVIRNGAGQPAAGVRVSAMVKPDNAAEETSSVSLAQTDEQGRYRLEDIPPGSYYIAAGSADLPTYYPGTVEVAKGTAVSVKAA